MWQTLIWINIYHNNSVISDFRNKLPNETSELLFGHKNVSKKIVKSHKSKCHYRKVFTPHCASFIIHGLYHAKYQPFEMPFIVDPIFKNCPLSFPTFICISNAHSVMKAQIFLINDWKLLFFTRFEMWCLFV